MTNQKLQKQKGREGEKTWLIYADACIKWCDKINNWLPNDEFFGTHNDAFAYAYKKYSKRFTLWEKEYYENKSKIVF